MSLLLFGAVSMALCLLLSAPASAVVGGKPVTGAVDWHAALIDLDRTVDPACTASGGSENFCKQFCSASLIAKRWVVTAAHCVDGIGNLSALRVGLGTQNLNDPAIDLYSVTNKFIPSGYGVAATYADDIALLHLDRDADYPYVPLADNTFETNLLALAPSLNDEVSQSGWGRLTATGDFPVRLQEVAIDLLNPDDCAVIYNGPLSSSFLTTTMLCASESEAATIEADDAGDVTPEDPDGEGSCQLDSGTGLLGQLGDDSYVVGVVSFGALNSCGDSQYPTVYTRISPYVTWIEAQATVFSEKMGDLALQVSVPASASPAQVVQATVTLANHSGNTSFSAVDFSLGSTAGATLAVIGTSGVNCDPPSLGVLTCHSAITLYANGQVSVTLTITPDTSGEQSVTFSGQLLPVAGGYTDYRQPNDTFARELAWTAQPDVYLSSVAVVPHVENSAGVADLFLTVGNRSASVDATGAQLALTLPAGYVISDPDGLSCTSGPVVCTIGTLAAGQTMDLHLVLGSAAVASGQVDLSLSAGNGDFPAGDTAATAVIAYNVVVTPGHRRGGGGAAGFIGLLLLLLPLRRVGRRVS